jgi:hypothetical protein
MVVFGGCRGDDPVWPDDLWSYRPAENPKRRWRVIKLAEGAKDTPGTRAFHAMVWRPSEKTAYVVGGTENLVDDKVWPSDVWVLRLHE